VVEDEYTIVAPRDEEAGGTWLGYNEEGVLSAITNRWTDADLAGERSRGLLVRDTLRQPSAEEAARHVERAVEAEAYEGFNLVLADGAAAVLLEWDGHLRVRNLTPGVHVVVNVGADGEFVLPEERLDAGRAQAEGAVAAREALQPDPGEHAGAWLERAADVLGDHDYGLCVHADGYGTRSTSLVRIGESGASFRHSAGPACGAEYETVRGSDIL